MKKILSPIILFAAAFIWGIAFVAQKTASEVPVFTLTASRSVIAALVLIPITALFDKLSGSGRHLISKRGVDITGRELIGGILCGIALFGATALQQAGINGTNPGKASFITALYVVIVPLYSLLFGKRSPLNVWVGVAVSVVGFYLLCIKSDFSISPADLLVFACAFVYAVQIMVIDHFVASCDGVRLSLIQFLTVTVLSLAAALIFELPIAVGSILPAMPEILYLGICSSGVAYTLQIIGQKHTHPAAASIILCMESVVGAIASVIILGESLSAREYIGCATVLFAVIISQVDPFSLIKSRKRMANSVQNQ
ncbi:MAG: DMT family transporter [Clostridia bacterium]|nr:DMT family transporter [Clostridia bacterium]